MPFTRVTVLTIAANELPTTCRGVEYLSMRPLEEVREMLGDCAHVLRAIGKRWQA